MTMREYAMHSHYFDVLCITTYLLLQQIDLNEKEKREEIECNVKNFDVICNEKELINLLLELLKISFKPKKILYCPILQRVLINNYVISRDNYDFIRNQIIKVNNIHLPKQAKTKELQDWFNKAYKVKNSQNKNSGDMEDIITSIMALTGYKVEDISNMTVYQINKLIARLNKISEYNTNIQFLCVGAEKIKLEHWSNKINEEFDNITTDFDSFTSTMNSYQKL